MPVMLKFIAPKKLDMFCHTAIWGKSKLLEVTGLFNHWLIEGYFFLFSFSFSEYKTFLGTLDAELAVYWLKFFKGIKNAVYG